MENGNSDSTGFLSKAGYLYVILGMVFSFLLTRTFTALIFMFFPKSIAQSQIFGVAVYAVLMVSMYFSVYRLNTTPEDRHAITSPREPILKGNILYVIIPLFLGYIINLLITTLIMRISPEAGRQISESSVPGPSGNGIPAVIDYFLIFIKVCIAAPLMEELIFRGFLFNFLGKRLGVTAGAVLSGVVFGSLHGNTFIQATVLGIIMALIYHVTGNLIYSILAHGVNNLFTLIITYVVTSSEKSPGINPGDRVMVLGLFFSAMVLITAVCLVAFIRNMGRYKGPWRSVTPVFREGIFTDEDEKDMVSVHTEHPDTTMFDY